jgi:chromate transport protein ChrA
MPRKNRERARSAIEVLLAFAKLGVSSFGGPLGGIVLAIAGLR